MTTSASDLLARVAEVGPAIRARLKARSTADLLVMEEVAVAIRAAVSPERQWRSGSLDEAGKLACACRGPGAAPLPETRISWFEEWGWAREANRQLVIGECPTCGVVTWAGGRV